MFHFKIPESNYDIWGDDPSPYELWEQAAQNSEKQRKILEEQIEPLKEIASSAKRQADSAEMQANLAVQKSHKADIKGWIAIIISILTFIMEICDRIGLF